MTRRTAPEVEAKAVAMLEVGLTQSDIAQELGLDLSTVKRIKLRNSVKPGSARSELVEEARSKLRQAIESDWIQEQAAKLIRDDLAHIRELRERINCLYDALPEPEDMRECGQLARSLTAISSALKNTSDMAHKSLGLNNQGVGEGKIPALVIEELTAEEVERIRDEQEAA